MTVVTTVIAGQVKHKNNRRTTHGRGCCLQGGSDKRNRGLLGSVSARQRVVVGVNHLGGRYGGLGRGFGDPGRQPCGRGMQMEEDKLTLVDGGVLGGKGVGIGAPVSRFGGGQNHHHTGLTGGRKLPSHLPHGPRA